MNKEIKQDIKKLKADKKYDEIFSKYGAKAYNKYVPNKYKKQDLKKLEKEGKYTDIYNKYGKNVHKQVLEKAMYKEIKEEKGTAKAVLWKLRKGMVKQAKRIGMAGLVTSMTFSGTAVIGTTSTINENSEKYEKDIEEYNERISDYTNAIKKMNLTNIQTFMKLMDDEWKSIQGYGVPKRDIMGFAELDFLDENASVVCRNFAKDFKEKADKLGFETQTITVQLGDEGKYKGADIECKIIEDRMPEHEEKESGTVSKFLKDNILANHMITLVKIPEDNVILAIDPTNPGIGIYYQGEIKMFNSDKEDGLDFDSREYLNSVMFGIDGTKSSIEFYADSWDKPDLSLEELENKYGIEAQNEALKEVRAMVDKDVKNDFYERIKVNSSNEERKEVNENENINQNNIRANEEEEMQL